MATKLQCEICGGKLVGKPGGIFECENCGMEFSTEWAKAKIQEITGTVKVEGTVEVQGSVKVEGAANVESLVKRGNLALRDEQWEKAENVFNKVLEIEPENGEAYFGLWLSEQKFKSYDIALKNVPDCWDLRADALHHAKDFGNEELKTKVSSLEKAWKEADQSNMLPRDMQTRFIIRNGVLRSKEYNKKKEYELFRGCNFEGRRITIPRCVKTIGPDTFYEAKNLESVTIPNGVTRVGSNAFRNCENLRSVTIPGSVKTIEWNTFFGCDSLERVIIENGVTTIDLNAFLGAHNIRSIEIPKSITSIHESNFGTRIPTIYYYGECYAKRFFEGKYWGSESKFVLKKTAEMIAAERKAAEEKAKAERRAAEEKAKAEREAKIEALTRERAQLTAELPNVKGLFAGSKKAKIEARLAEIESELAKL